MKTTWTKESEVSRTWYLIDAKDQILGRLATKVASLLIGKGKVDMVPNLDCGDYVVIINSKDIKVTRKKGTQKMYYSHSGYPGGFKEIPFNDMLVKNPIKPIQLAVKRMLPSNKLKATMMARLFIYEGSEHKQQAQNPVEIKLS